MEAIDTLSVSQATLELALKRPLPVNNKAQHHNLVLIIYPLKLIFLMISLGVKDVNQSYLVLHTFNFSLYEDTIVLRTASQFLRDTTAERGEGGRSVS